MGHRGDGDRDPPPHTPPQGGGKPRVWAPPPALLALLRRGGGQTLVHVAVEETHDVATRHVAWGHPKKGGCQGGRGDPRVHFTRPGVSSCPPQVPPAPTFLRAGADGVHVPEGLHEGGVRLQLPARRGEVLGTRVSRGGHTHACHGGTRRMSVPVRHPPPPPRTHRTPPWTRMQGLA